MLRQWWLTLFLSFSFVAVFCVESGAIPSQYGDSGLFTQPSAETLNAGNICVGLWVNQGQDSGDGFLITPATITLGLGAFLEAYGSYPNLLFNDEELNSGRGFSNVGFKLRLIGERSSSLKLALDGQIRRTISDNPVFDNLTDKVGRAILSYRLGKFGLHFNAGKIYNQNPTNVVGFVNYKDQIAMGGGIEFYPWPRLRLIAEMEVLTPKEDGKDGPSEALGGFQYFLSPHLTINAALAYGLTDESPDLRTLIGFSSCQGVGTYVKPIAKLPEFIEDVEAKETEAPVKVLKVRTLTPLIPKPKPAPIKPVSRLEVPVETGDEEVLLIEGDRLSAAGALAGALAVAPVIAPAPAVSPGQVGEVGSELAGSAVGGISYTVGDPVFTDSGRIVGQKVLEDPPGQQAKFTSLLETDDYMEAVFYHQESEALPVWIEGDIKYEFSTTVAKPYEVVKVKVFRDDIGDIPSFKLHIGKESEVFSFFPDDPEALAALEARGIRLKTKTAASSQSLTPSPRAVMPAEKTSAASSAKVGKLKLLSGPSRSLAAGAAAAPAPVDAGGKVKLLAGKASTSSGATVAADKKVEPLSPLSGPANNRKTLSSASAQLAEKGSVKAVVYRKFVLPQFTFEFDQFTLSEEGHRAIAEISEELRKDGRWFFIRFDGHTDSIGSEEYNNKLSVKRAVSAATAMAVNNGFDPARMFVKGFGESKPMALNATDEGRAKNRRVEVLVLVPKEE